MCFLFALFPKVQKQYTVRQFYFSFLLKKTQQCELKVFSCLCLSSTCVLDCPVGYWGDRKRCKKCYLSCMMCLGSRSDQCTSCKPGYHLDEEKNTCVTSCVDGYYLNYGKCNIIKIDTSCHTLNLSHAITNYQLKCRWWQSYDLSLDRVRTSTEISLV